MSDSVTTGVPRLAESLRNGHPNRVAVRFETHLIGLPFFTCGKPFAIHSGIGLSIK